MKQRTCSPRTVRTLLASTLLLLSTFAYSQTSLPEVNITYPLDGSTVSGQTYITINTQFNLPLTGQEKQQIFIDGNLFWTASSINLVQPVLWNTTNTSLGTHTIAALVSDGLGNSATSAPITVTVSNSPGSTDTTPPIAPGNLNVTASCDSLNLSWAPSTDINGSGVREYAIYRNGINSMTIAADRNWFADADGILSNTAYTYYVTAIDFAGNMSVPSNAVTITTPACTVAASEEVFDNSDTEPSGRAIASYGALEAVVYQKLNTSTGRYDSYVQFKNESTGTRSNFLLHSDEYESDYVLSDATTLWAMAKNSSNILVNRYQLSGSPIPTSATLVATQSFGDSNSCAKSLLRLKSGSVIAAWTSDCADSGSTSYIQLSLAYWSASGQFWEAPFTFTLGTDTWKERIAMAQHPADGSIWIFNLEDGGWRIAASHFTELSNGLNLDWTNPWYIAVSDSSGNVQDGVNGPSDFPYLTAVSDSVHNTIDVAYQRNSNAFLFLDPLFQTGANGILQRENPVTVAEINSDGTRVFNASPLFTERSTYFAFSVSGNGTMWLAYFPMNQQSLTWNRVYAASYANGSWGAPKFTGSDLNGVYDWDLSGPRWDPGFLISRPDQPQAAFRAPDGRIHTYNLDGTPVIASTTPPSTPSNLVGSSITASSVLLSWTASTASIGVAGYNVYRCQGVGCTLAQIASVTGTSYQDTGLLACTTYGYEVSAYDAAGNVSGLSAPVSVTTNCALSPTVNITNPANGAKLKTTSVTVSSSATDTAAIVKMQLYIDGACKSQSSSSSLSYKWNTSKLASGAHTITANAYDSAGHVGTTTITVYK